MKTENSDKKYTKMKNIVAGIDIGGTNVSIGIVDKEGNILFNEAFAISKYKTAIEFVKFTAGKIKSIIEQFPTNIKLHGIGIGAPNGNYYQGIIEYAPNLKWDGIIPLRDMFKEFFDIPIVLTNDANAATIGEMIYGGAKGMKDFILITLGTGLGSGFVANGELILGHDSFAGELGHTIVFRNGRNCGCGRKGCLETYASAPGILRTVSELLAKRNHESELRNIPQNKITAKIISEYANKGDLIAKEAFEYTGKILGFKLSEAVAITSPEAIFLFGGLAKAGNLLFEPTKKYMDKYLLNIYKNKIKLLSSSLDENYAAILGAAAIAWKEIE
ncbi:MAG: ROK family protein [Bacteroidales bacterium]|jgi:glucokinase|nr:ROK family protein [Bacteroidales bacterium]